MDSSKEKYNQGWFQERALKSLKKMKDGAWDFSDSLLLYTSSGADTYEQLQEVDTPYFKLVTQPEREYLQLIAKQTADMLPDYFEYIDLGPGTEHKEQFLFDELKKQGKKFTYIPVDISDYFLNIADTHAKAQGINTRPVKASFEELPNLFGNTATPRFVSLGLTFSNYKPQEALQLLIHIARDQGYVFINAQIRDRIDMIELQKVYQDDAVRIADEKVQLIGLNSDTDISPRIANDGFQVWCTILRSNDILNKIGVQKGDQLMVFQSLRYTKEQLEKELSNFNHLSFDTGGSFIASVIKT